MLKVQLGSKIPQLSPQWRGIEDILTGDFFGALDYLPRDPFFSDFLQSVIAANEPQQSPEIEHITWSDVEFLFWPMTKLKKRPPSQISTGPRRSTREMSTRQRFLSFLFGG